MTDALDLEMAASELHATRTKRTIIPPRRHSTPPAMPVITVPKPSTKSWKAIEETAIETIRPPRRSGE